MAIVLSATRSFLEPSAAWRDLPEIKEADVRKHKKCCNALEHFKDVAIPRFEKNAYRNF
jgi:hypothetical protein